MKSIWPKPLVKAFYALIGHKDSNGCRRWLGERHPKGYGVFRYEGRAYMAHKLYLCIKQNIPYIHKKDMVEKLDAAHNCPGGVDHPWCVVHSEWMDSKQHAADKAAKGQMPNGDQHWSHTKPEKLARGDKHGTQPHPEKLTKEEKQRMKEMHAGGWSIAELAKEFHVSRDTVRVVIGWQAPVHK